MVKYNQGVMEVRHKNKQDTYHTFLAVLGTLCMIFLSYSLCTKISDIYRKLKPKKV